MIRDGTGGTASGDGLAGILNRVGRADASAWYNAARIYNSGSLPGSDDLDGTPRATLCYVSDIANRLTGEKLMRRRRAILGSDRKGP